ncbi:MAG: winged helix DNA-binding domain-containing protein [Chloroflexota bacterium]
MTKRDIANLRLANQQISAGELASPKDLVYRMGALQAQDFRSVKWAIGLRIPGCTADVVDKAIDDGDIIRTHVLRPTWHFVSPGDLAWMLDLSAPKIMPSLKYRQDFLGLKPEILSRSNEIIAKSLKGRQSGREEIAASLKSEGIELRTGGDTVENRLSHILLWAELSGIICSGKTSRDKQTYALISERIPAGKKPARKEALGMLASKYFKSHGPATLKDFGWWSGLSSGDIRTALEIAGDELESTEIDSVKYWYGKTQQPANDVKRAWLIPAFDEIIISYTDRSALMSSDNHGKAVSSNGIFRPVLIVDNLVAGLWKTVKAKDRLIVEITSFRSLKKQEKKLIEEAAEAYGSFTGLKTEVKYT